ncbi:MAG: 2OG-Fe(II) oxygenase family protein, partial [Gammaproteobacteria bacterium]
DDIGGLELQLLDGDWVAVPPIPGTFVVNVGDLLERWSNGRYRSTPHRVINSSGRERLSLVLAYDPNFETLVDPSAFCAAGETPRDEPITCGDYLMWRFKKAFSYRQ